MFKDKNASSHAQVRMNISSKKSKTQYGRHMHIGMQSEKPRQTRAGMVERFRAKKLRALNTGAIKATDSDLSVFSMMIPVS